MKFFKKANILLLSTAILLSIAGCGKKTNVISVDVKSDSLYVTKVDNLSSDFIKGMDSSAVLSLEKAGVKYYDFNGEEQDVFKTLAENGINYIRVRIWNDPFDKDGNGYGGGNCDIETAIEIGKRANKYGMKLLANFHYSDFWADPSKQMVPKAWKGMDIDTKAEALYNYTVESLNKLKAAKVDVGMIQIGNETTGKFCGENVWFKMATLFENACKACREVYPKSLIALHFTNPEKIDNFKDYAKKLAYYEIDYDVFGTSYYPYWHGTMENLASILTFVNDTYDKKTMILETSYCNTLDDTDFNGNTISSSGGFLKTHPFSVQGQANFIRDLVDNCVNKTKNCIGVCYWEGTWISVGGSSWEENSKLWEQYGCGWASSYAAEYDPNDAGKYYGGCVVDNQAFFDQHGKPIESLKVWGLLEKGNKVEVKADAIEDTELIIDLAGEINLPDKVNAVLTDNSKQQIPVTWKNVDIDKMKNGGVAKYDIVGEAGGMEAHCFISMVEFNFLENYSFEADANKTRQPSGWKVVDLAKANELWVEDKQTDSLTGTKHFHFWAQDTNNTEFTLEQEVKNLPSGTYKYTISVMGGDCGAQDVYMYVKIDGEIVSKKDLKFTTYGTWDTQVINDIVYEAGHTITVGIYVKCEGSGSGAWGKIDDALLNSQK